ncbi:hypothetical protein SIN07_08295 [Pediococcus inopinatus]|mgnify:CR=1 FL=1|uniref:Uncharacterized protein n=1 Tax=Pediococcus inopinatus TaxID=114090 RepID=A0ABZ0Q6U7_9LACO|nr:hypothetical protein [Pediococcus inopinatus]AVK99323.1 hypothetical protein PI20285_00900 [Pediococcus inopinatus]KRN62207.1 hypothetical protein IV83_GL000317 [Pediococcus inopinatus]WPC18246.1 hypothetical protein N6G94_04415 [Pediococcus inopinatus]WPC20365.1 hypothetical protein N6G95_04040 [Pediococcus inopinatus]WPC22069.1 hypothetical protein N6G96_02295 [Pediococcus inopinatus]
MTEYVKVYGKTNQDLVMPDEFGLVSSDLRKRNGEQVRVERYQHGKNVVPNNAHVTLVFGEDERLISYNNFVGDLNAPLPAKDALVQQAMAVWQNLDAQYAAGLDFMRIDNLKRFYFDEQGKLNEFAVLWVKFAHRNGSYNWVTFGPGGQIMEVERESHWDYMRSRRATEEWNYDNWVLAREGKGPQLAAPEALA